MAAAKGLPLLREYVCYEQRQTGCRDSWIRMPIFFTICRARALMWLGLLAWPFGWAFWRLPKSATGSFAAQALIRRTTRGLVVLGDL